MFTHLKFEKCNQIIPMQSYYTQSHTNGYSVYTMKHPEYCCSVHYEHHGSLTLPYERGEKKDVSY